MPEGTIVSNCEGKLGDRGAFARASGTSAVVIGHSEDGKKTTKTEKKTDKKKHKNRQKDSNTS